MTAMPAPAVSAAPEQWKDVAERVRGRRLALGLNQHQVGASRSVVSNLESCKQHSYARRSLADVARALQWTPDSIERILSGGDPVEADRQAAEHDRIAALEAALPRLEAELQEVKAALASEMAQVKGLLRHGVGRSATPLPVDPTDINPGTMVPNEDDPDEMELWGFAEDQGGTREYSEVVQAVIEYRRRKYDQGETGIA